ncbi:hypothetical protein F7734_50530 [Scytonema sp. UIC 10036]|uniref:hypothetical protein n=1 Tax=Scytonema sp. UIC 10036 TaxID=2304196 RepID=UPI0012DADC86|nr:hypothetical protein [Scytonema sp. UIC 10036]MUH00079.1 hypothetical protein [Scytonema sp. UIC 10036]
MRFNHIYYGVFVGSTLLGITGLIQAWNSEGFTKSLALTVGVAGTTSALVCAGLGIAYSEKHQSLEKETADKIYGIEQSKNRELTDLKISIDNLKSSIKVLETQEGRYTEQISNLKSQLNEKSEQFLRIVAEKDLRIGELQGIVSERDKRVEEFLEDSRNHTRKFFLLRYNQLVLIEKDLMKLVDSPAIKQRLKDVRELKDEMFQAMEEIKQLDIKDFQTVLDFIFEFDNSFLGMKVRWRNSLLKSSQQENKGLKESLKNSMPLDIAIARHKEGLDEVDAQITEKYENLLLHNNSIHAQLLDLLEKRNLVIDDLTKEVENLQNENKELQKPLLAIGASDYALAANRIANYYFENYGYKLDVINWIENETGYSILFATRKNPGLTETELLPHNTQEQLAAFTNALQGTLPKFTFNYQHSTVTLDVTLRKPVKKEHAKNDIDKLWVPVERFESYVKNWERIRITAGSTGGKSPTAKNLALAIMKSRNGQGEIKLYDPQHGSKKDYWDMPKAGTSHEDNVTGMAELCSKLDQRTKSPGNHPFVLYIFDEVDSTIAQEREKNGYYYFKDKVTYSLKQASHQSIGAIYIGQSADASTIPGMSWSDWNSAVQLHIGANAGVWINKATTITAEQKTKLLEQNAKIQEYCDKKNEDLGLDIFTDPTAYRFALAVPLSGQPKFIQLPDFDSYDYWEVMGEKEAKVSTNTQKGLISNILDEVEKEVATEIVKPVIKCPHCGSDDFRSKGERWLCQNPSCGKTWLKNSKK